MDIEENTSFAVPKEEIILLDARGQIYKVCESVLRLSQYFNNMLGNGKFEGSKKQKDGSYYVDCDIEVLKLLIGFIETDILLHCQYDIKYLKKIFAKFGVDLEYKKMPDPMKKFEQNFLKQLQQLFNEKKGKDTFFITCKFILGNDIFIRRDCDSILATIRSKMYVENLSRNPELLRELFGPFSVDIQYEYQMGAKFLDRGGMYDPYILSIKFTRPEIIEEAIDANALLELDLNKPANSILFFRF